MNFCITKKIIAFVALFSLYFSTTLFSQEQLKHTPKMYKSSDGKLYMNKSQPMYLWISTSPGNESEKIRLESEKHKKYSNPFYFDTEGYNSIRTPWCVDTTTKQVVYPLEDIIFEVYADSRPPVSKITYDKSKVYYRDKKAYVAGEVVIKISANDELSGVERTLISINKEPFKDYTGEINLKEEKEYFIQYYSVDNVGNIEEIKTQTVVIDLSKPKTYIDVKKDKYENIVSGKTHIEILAEESGSGIEKIFYSIDNEPEKIYSKPIPTSLLSEGEHTIKFRGIDRVGNQEDNNTYEFYVDKTPPLIVEEIIGNKFISNNIEYSSGRSKYKINAMDNKAGIKEIYYSINNGEKKLYTEPFYLEEGKGKITIRAFAIDNVNNESTSGQTSQANSKMYVDLAGPSLIHKFDGPFFSNRDTVFISDKTKITLQGTDKESGMDYIEYSINNETMNRYTEPFSIEDNGLTNIHFIGYDKVGNSNNSNFSFYVDSIAPEIFVRYSVNPIGNKTILDKKMEVYPNHVIVFLSATDDKSGLMNIKYKINNSAQKIYSEPISNLSPGRDYKIEVLATDKLGNMSNKEIEFSVN